MLFHFARQRARFTSILVLLAALGFLSFAVSPLSAAEHTPFAIIGDTHVGVSTSVYPFFIEAIDKLGIKMIIHLGDAVDNANNATQWAEFREITGTGKTLYLVQGNHDVGGRGSSARSEIPAKLFQTPYYSFSEDDTLFVILNTELPGQRGTVSSAQYEWLETELQRSFRYKFVFLHRPPFSLVPGHGLDSNPTARDRLHDLFVSQGVAAVFSGHDHVYNRTQHDGVTYVIASGGGGPLYFSSANGGFFHYVVVSRENNAYSFTVKDMKGEVRDHFLLGK
jgi:acid phosphatase type 7